MRDRDAAFTEFVSTRQRHLRRVAYALCGDWHRADDLLQTALAKLYVAWPRIRREGNEEAYVRQIMVRANIDESRRPWLGLSVRETAQEMGISEGTVKSHSHRGLAALESALAVR